MCVLLGSEVILKNAFAAMEKKAVKCLKFQDLRNFCNIIFDKMEENENIRSKYVYLQVDEADIEEYCESEGDFTRGIDKIYMNFPADKDTLLTVNGIYSSEIQQVLADAREEFASAC